MAEKKLGRGKRQPSRAKYKATNKRDINAKKRAESQAHFIALKHHDCHHITRGAARRNRRAKWLQSVGFNTDGQPAMDFAHFEKRESGMSAWDYQRSIFGSKQESTTLTNLRNKLAA
jgi:hypothetical protein